MVCNAGYCDTAFSCVGTGSYCTYSSDCCGLDLCVGGICGGSGYGCVGYGSYCSYSSDCCGSDLCIGGYCS